MSESNYHVLPRTEPNVLLTGRHSANWDIRGNDNMGAVPSGGLIKSVSKKCH